MGIIRKMKNKMVSLDTVLLFILVLARVHIAALIDIVMPKSGELVRISPLFTTIVFLLLFIYFLVDLAGPKRVGCVQDELETLPQVGREIVLYTDLPCKTRCFGIKNGNLREGCSSHQLKLNTPTRVYKIKLCIIFFLIFLTVIANSFFAIMMRHLSDPWRYAHDGGVLQTEEAIEYFLNGKNPYAEDYTDSSLMKLRGPDHPAVYHYPYLPATFLLSSPLYLVSRALLGWYDQRFVYLPLFLLTLLLLPSFASDKTKKLLLVMTVGLNPTMATDLVVGMNDSFVLFCIVLSLYLLLKERLTLSAVALGLACASKATAWFLAPFYLLYLCRGRKLSRRDMGFYLKRLSPLFLTVLLFIAPFLVWNPTAMIDDVWGANVGTAPNPFPLGGFGGWGFANFILALGWVKTRQSYFPFWILEAIIGLPLLLYLLKRQMRENSLDAMLIGYSLFLFAVLYFSRFLHYNYLGYILAFFALGYLCEQ